MNSLLSAEMSVAAVVASAPYAQLITIINIVIIVLAAIVCVCMLLLGASPSSVLSVILTIFAVSCVGFIVAALIIGAVCIIGVIKKRGMGRPVAFFFISAGLLAALAIAIHWLNPILNVGDTVLNLLGP